MPTKENIQAANAAKPMRWKSGEKLAREFTLANLNQARELERTFLDWLRGVSEVVDLAEGSIPSLDALTRWERNKSMGIYDDLDLNLSPKHAIRLENAKKADVDASELARLLSQLALYLSPDQIQAMENIFAQMAGVYFNQSFSGPGIWNGYLPRVFEEGFEEGVKQVQTAARRAGTTEQVALVLPNALGFSLDSPIIQNYYFTAFQRVTSKVSTSFKGQFIGEMITGLSSGLDWRTIARNIHQVAGVASRYHWSRLTRTELTYAYRETMQQTYTRAGVQYLYYSPNIGACPVCRPLRGYYRYESVRWPPIHPNCLCRTVPFFRLPEGVELRG